MSTDVAWYFQIAQREYPELLVTHHDMPNNIRAQIIAETTYFYLHDCLPDWVSVLERVEAYLQPDGTTNYLFIQGDTID